MRLLPLFLARRLLYSSQSEKSLHTMVIISFITLIISSCSLMLVAAIMQGFEEKTYEKFQGIHPDLTIRAYGNELDYQKISHIVTQEFSESIEAITPFAFQHALLQNPQEQEIQKVITLVAIDPQTLIGVTRLTSFLQENGSDLSTLLAHRGLLVGATTAQHLGVHPSEKVSLLYIANPSGEQQKISFDAVQAHLGALFKTGIDEFDSQFVFCSYEFFESLFPHIGITQVGLKLKPGANGYRLSSQLKQRLGIDVYSWQELYAPLFAALTLEKYVATAVLSLMTLVASAILIALMFMFVAAKKNDIAILRAMGMRFSDIKYTFLSLGMGLSLIASCIGTVIALIISLLLEYAQLITIPDVYYVSYVPAHLTWWMVVGLFVFTSILSFFATLIPLQEIKNFNLMRLLKFE